MTSLMQDPKELQLLQFDIIRDEGMVNHNYQDSLGNWTYGVGHKGRLRPDNAILTEQEMIAILQKDIREKWEELMHVIPWIVNLNYERQRVLLNIAFNVGVDGLVRFKKTLSYAHAGEFKAASKEILNSKAARQLPLRYARLGAQMSSGVRE